jgi:hypothetical protein
MPQKYCPQTSIGPTESFYLVHVGMFNYQIAMYLLR